MLGSITPTGVTPMMTIDIFFSPSFDNKALERRAGLAEAMEEILKTVVIGNYHDTQEWIDEDCAILYAYTCKYRK